MQRVAVLGLGIIGSGIAHNVLRAGFPLAIYNRSSERAAPFEQSGATVTASAREAAAGANVVICAVANDEASEAIWLGEDGALAGAQDSAILIECSTLSSAWIGHLSGAIAARGLQFLDAPVLGSKDAAQAGELRLLVGGDADAVERARPVLEAFSSEINHMGPVGAGTQMKLINNAMGAVQIAALAEGLAVAERAGLSLDQVSSILANGAPGSPMVKGRAGRMVAHDYEDVHFALRWMHKDIGYALAEGARYGVPLATVEAARAAFGAAVERGLGDLDFCAVLEAVRT